MCDDRVILKREKRMREYYYMVESLVRDGALKARGSLVQGGALDGGGSDMRCKTREDKRRHRRVKFLLP